MAPKQRIERRFQSARHTKLDPEAVQEVPQLATEERGSADPAGGSAPKVITGYAAVFGVDTSIESFFGAFNERIKKGAFRRALREGQDVRALMNHDPNLLLARSASKTLRMKEDDIGLSVSIDTADTCAGRDCAELVARGDMSGMSFAFIPRKVTWINGTDGQPDLRIIEDVDLYDVGPVTYPAYEQTSADVEEYSKIHQEGLRQMVDEKVITPEQYQTRTSRKTEIASDKELTPTQIREIDEKRDDDPPLDPAAPEGLKEGSEDLQEGKEVPAVVEEVLPAEGEVSIELEPDPVDVEALRRELDLTRAQVEVNEVQIRT